MYVNWFIVIITTTTILVVWIFKNTHIDLYRSERKKKINTKM